MEHPGHEVHRGPGRARPGDTKQPVAAAVFDAIHRPSGVEGDGEWLVDAGRIRLGRHAALSPAGDHHHLGRSDCYSDDEGDRHGHLNEVAMGRMHGDLSRSHGLVVGAS
jgi:hypothetical protein